MVQISFHEIKYAEMVQTPGQSVAVMHKILLSNSVNNKRRKRSNRRNDVLGVVGAVGGS